MVASLLRALGLRGRLARLLDDYPRYIQPYPGAGKALTDAKATLNFEHFMAQRPERLRIVGELLAKFGLDVGSAMTGDPKPFLKRLAAWMHKEWPAVRDPEQADFMTWFNGPHGGRADLSLIVDMAILHGEIMIAHVPDAGWAVNLGSNHRGVTHWRRITLNGRRIGIADLESMFHQVYQRSGGQHRWDQSSIADSLIRLLYVAEVFSEMEDAAQPVDVAEDSIQYAYGFAFHGVKLKIAALEAEAVESGQDRRLKAANEAGLDYRIERLPGERDYIFVGLPLADLEADETVPAFDDPETLARRAEIDARLRAAGFPQKSGLHVEWVLRW
ncbi:MAG: hypothetical protein EON95_09170 [Caulobacteraceae bacterium]|nr:MAG: hypothetical protein EON95_09170 [Caulobacteraceae bacterium]